MTALSGTPTTLLGLKTFAAGDVPDLYSATGGLTEVLNQIDVKCTGNSMPTTAKTASATLTAAESVGYRVTMTSATATTITINTGVFAANDSVFITNLGTGVCTVTAGTATVSSAGSLAIPRFGSGLLVMTATGSGIYYPSAITGNAVDTVASASSIAVVGNATYLLTGTTGVTTVTGGVSGNALTLIASGQAAGICVVLNNGTGANNLSLRDGANLGIYAGESVTFVFNSSGYWVETGRNLNNQLAYAEKLTTTSITTTTANGADVATTSAVTMDGSTAIIAVMWTDGLAKGSNWVQPIFAVDGAVVYLGGYQTSTNTGPATTIFRYTPTAGSHTFGFRAKVDAGTGSVGANSGQPNSIRISRAI